MWTRLQQGVRALFSWARPVEDDPARQLLTPPLLALFKRMRRSEQQHSLAVHSTLRGWGYADPPLLAAALLHDIGKSRAEFHLWDRVLVVLVKAIAPDRVKAWGSAELTGWRRPFAVSVQHPRWSAEMVAAAGADPLAVDLIAAHQTHLDHPPQTERERLLVALQAADDAN